MGPDFFMSALWLYLLKGKMCDEEVILIVFPTLS